jgi:plastocyanin
VIGGPVELTDPDGDGRYAGAFTYSGAATAAAGMAAAPQAHLLVWDGVVERDYPFELQPLPQPVVRDARTKQPLSGVRVNLLQKFTPPGRASYFVGVGADTTGPDGAYAFSVGEGAYRLEASKVGYQTYRSPSFDVDGIWLGRDILLMPTLAAAAATASAPVYQVHMTRDGYELPELAVRTGSVVAFINLDLDEHTATGAGWDSGVLGPGESFSILADANGAFPYQDEVGRLSRGRIVVGPNAPLPGRHTWLPLTLR